MVLFGMWVGELIEKSKTLWTVASSESLFIYLCFPLSFELHSRKSCWSPSSDENRTGENEETRVDGSEDYYDCCSRM